MKISVFLDNNITTTTLNQTGEQLSFIGLELTNIYMETDLCYNHKTLEQVK